MKKFLTLLAGVLCFAAVASAQPRAFGLRIGYGAEVSYQHDLGDAFAEMDLGLVGKDGFYVSGIYDFVIGTSGIFNFYAGPGVIVGAHNYEDADGYVLKFNAGIVGQLGAEVQIESAPVSISLDWRPAYYFNYGDFGWTSLALGIRYRF
jgi:hypothetical protein